MTAPVTGQRTCYRHPDRVAGISCQRCDRPICPTCMHQASVGFHCPECSRAGEQKGYRGLGSLVRQPIVTQVLIGVNVVAFVLMAITAGMEPFTAGGRFLLGQRDLSSLTGQGGLFTDGALFGAFVPEEPWRLLSGGFLHAPLPFGLVHIGLNMLVLYRFGQMLEPILGRLRFAALYTTGLCGGALGVVILSPRSLTIGASGAVFGLMGGAVLVARERNVDLLRSGLLPTIGINLVFTLGISFVSVGGHVGGLIGGLVGGTILTEGARRMGPKGDATASALAGAVALGSLVVAFVLMNGEYGMVFPG